MLMEAPRERRGLFFIWHSRTRNLLVERQVLMGRDQQAATASIRRPFSAFVKWHAACERPATSSERGNSQRRGLDTERVSDDLSGVFGIIAFNGFLKHVRHGHALLN
jgi:hypothetical protein